MECALYFNPYEDKVCATIHFPQLFKNYFGDSSDMHFDDCKISFKCTFV